jgi:hypothetical protein
MPTPKSDKPRSGATPHGLAFAPTKLGVLIDIDMGTTGMAGKCRAGA